MLRLVLTTFFVVAMAGFAAFGWNTLKNLVRTRPEDVAFRTRYYR